MLPRWLTSTKVRSACRGSVAVILDFLNLKVRNDRCTGSRSTKKISMPPRILNI
jgi:hypothetical protein